MPVEVYTSKDLQVPQTGLDGLKTKMNGLRRGWELGTVGGESEYEGKVHEILK